MAGLLLVAVPSFGAYTLSSAISDTGSTSVTIALTVTLGTNDDSAEEIAITDIISAAADQNSHIGRVLKGLLIWVSAKPGTGGAAPSAALTINWYTANDALKIPQMTGYSTTLHNKVEVADVHVVSFMDIQNSNYMLLNDFGSTGDSYTIYLGILVQ